MREKQNPPKQSNDEFIRNWFEDVWNKGRLEVIDERVSPNAVGHGQAEHNVDVGPAEFKQLAIGLRTAFPDIRITIHDTLTQGDKVLARWTATMTQTGTFLGNPATARKATVTGMSIQRVVD